MKKIAVLGMLLLLMVMMLVTTQALASPASVIAKSTGNPHGTEEASGTELPPPGHTPGAQATAHAGLHGKPQIFRGTIAQVDSSTLVLTLPDGSTQAIGLIPQTKIHVPGPKSAGDVLVVGMRAMAMTYDQAGSLVARMVVAIPGQPVHVHRVGTVTAYTADSSITIKATDGNTYTFDIAPDAKILPAGQAANPGVGSLVTIIAPRDPSTTVWTAKGIVVHPSP